MCRALKGQAVNQDLEENLNKKRVLSILPRRTGLRHGCWVVEIDLSGRQDVDGDLDERFKELTNLEQLNLQATMSSGDIGVLGHNTKLKHLNLGDTNVVGDLTALKNAAELTYLNLQFSDIGGNLTALKKATRLKELNLQYTNVDGDVMALENATELTHLNLADTRVVGELSRLRPLENCDVSGTRISCKGEEDALRAILLELGLTAEHVADLKNVAGVERRMLSCRYEVFPVFFVFTWFGSALRNMFENWSNWIMLDQSATH